MSTKTRFSDIDCSFKRLTPIYGFQSQKLVSIDEALKPIESQIDQLQYYIKIAKKHCHYPSSDGLTRDESASIYIYTMEWGEQTLYRLLNQALRNENRQIIKIWFPYLKLFHSALNKLPTVKEIIWRGIPEDIGKHFIKNQLLTWWSINSCSSSVNVIKHFLGDNQKSTMFLIEALKGKKVSGYTEYENEDEIILSMGTQFRVKSNALDHPNGSYIVHLIEINDDEDNEDSLATATNQINLTKIKINQKTKFQQNGTIVAGGNGEGNQLNQLFRPVGIFVDENKNIFIADHNNHRIVEWKCDEKQGQIIAGGNGRGERIDQLYWPTDVIVDQQNHSIIIADRGNRRVMRWSRDQKQQILIQNIHCFGLTMDQHGFIYVSAPEKNEVRKWKLEKINKNKEEILVAGGNGEGNQRNQLDCPTHIFVDKDQSLYVSDRDNYRVMKWRKDAKEGIVVAGGNGQGNNLNQLNGPEGLFVDEWNQIYVADSVNHRIMRWCEGDEEGEIVVGGNGKGSESNQLNYPSGLSFDLEGNLYVSDWGNDRIVRFDKIH
ncbi:hypothetical protein I4U23_005867 [Adineta vaga]|nr:hypothetical protein I4U23_005867 [Adineta vaga]